MRSNWLERPVSSFIGLKLEVGKWYEITSSCYTPGEHISKFLKLEGYRCYYSERIINGKYTKKVDYHSHGDNVKEVSLEEIQKYLPEYHPDIIPPLATTLTPKKLAVQLKDNWDILKQFEPFDENFSGNATYNFYCYDGEYV